MYGDAVALKCVPISLHLHNFFFSYLLPMIFLGFYPSSCLSTCSIKTNNNFHLENFSNYWILRSIGNSYLISSSWNSIVMDAVSWYSHVSTLSQVSRLVASFKLSLKILKIPRTLSWIFSSLLTYHFCTFSSIYAAIIPQCVPPALAWVPHLYTELSTWHQHLNA